MSEDTGRHMGGEALRGGGGGTLYVVATPIGNLSDMSERSMQVLRSVAWVAAEDTRTTRVLLDRVGSRARAMSTHRHNERESAAGIVALLEKGHDVALVSDAGTPAVSDPGARVVAGALDAGLRVVPIPGPSAAIAMISASGLADGPFHFEGFLPARARARDQRLEQLAGMPHPFVLFEAPHRIADTLPAIAAHCGVDRPLAIGRELTKKFEEVHRCRAGEAAAWLAADPDRQRGEYVLVVGAAPQAPASGRLEEAGRADPELRRLLTALLAELPPASAVRVAVQATGLPRRQLYRLALEIGQAAEAADAHRAVSAASRTARGR